MSSVTLWKIKRKPSHLLWRGREAVGAPCTLTASVCFVGQGEDPCITERSLLFFDSLSEFLWFESLSLHLSKTFSSLLWNCMVGTSLTRPAAIFKKELDLVTLWVA